MDPAGDAHDAPPVPHPGSVAPVAAATIATVPTIAFAVTPVVFALYVWPLCLKVS
ncbi:hypothetical protein R52603_00332 [Paraburkholderia saeva]|nr:hypothetical protein R52603_00332 [Paraburkholderia saeva]